MPLFCSSCDAANPKDASFCGECGQSLGEMESYPQGQAAPDAPQRSGRGRRRTAPGSSVERSMANRELGRAMRVLLRVKRLYVVLAILSGLATVIVAFAALQVAGGALLWLFVGVYAALTALYVFGALFVQRNPFLWSVILAALTTLNVVSDFVFNGRIPFVGVLLAVFCWAAVSVLANVNRLVKQFPELRAAKRIRGEKFMRSGERGEVGAKLAARRIRERNTKLTIAGVAVAVVVLAIVGYNVFGRDPRPAQAGGGRAGAPRAYEQPAAPLAPVLAQFEAAWRARDLAAIGALYPERLARRARVSYLERRFDKHAMQDFPALGEAFTEVSGDLEQRAHYETERREVEVVFKFEGDRWVMVALRFS